MLDLKNLALSASVKYLHLSQSYCMETHHQTHRKKKTYQLKAYYFQFKPQLSYENDLANIHALI
jgi:hypothetical protein